MDGHDGPGVGGESVSDAGGVDVAGGGVDVGPANAQAVGQDRPVGGGASQGGSDDPASARQVEEAESQGKAGSGGVDSQEVRIPQPRAEGFFEFFHPGALGEEAGRKNPLHGLPRLRGHRYLEKWYEVRVSRRRCRRCQRHLLRLAVGIHLRNLQTLNSV